jgi:DNA-binding XRE family transcriptional regulator
MAHPNNTKILKLRVLIARKNQMELAKEIGLSRSCVNQLEIGTQVNPSLDTIIKYLNKFNISIFEFVDQKTAKKLIISFTKNLVDDKIITHQIAADICKHLSVKL